MKIIILLILLCTYLLTYFTEQSPWEGNWSADSQEIPRILWNPKVHYCIHKWPPPVPIQSISPGPGFSVWTIRNMVSFSSEELLAPRPNPRGRTTHCRLSETLYSIYSQLPSILEAVPPSATWRRAMSWWQGPTDHGSRYYMAWNVGTWW